MKRKMGMSEMRIIVDGILYNEDEYPDEMERISALKAHVEMWKRLAVELTREKMKLQELIEEQNKKIEELKMQIRELS